MLYSVQRRPETRKQFQSTNLLSENMHSSFVFLALASFGSIVNGLPAGNAPALVARDCSAEITAYNMARAEKRGLDTRSLWLGLQNTTCILSPESPKDNYVAGSPVTSDITGGQTGIAFTLDVGLMDITTCKPLTNTMVEVWSPNALGSYGNSFLRGAFTSATNGVAEFQTIFPGFASDSANHINLMIHTNSSMSGTVSHVGQVFFTDRWTDVVGMTAPYNGNTNTRVLNAQDSNYALANSAGYNAVVDIESIHDDWPEGVIGYITVGVNPQRKV
ncbi:aromatic compound dioxygenase, partial [Macrolepiota fuliginosa MF-IS2]